jgi:hypothetical protein
MARRHLAIERTREGSVASRLDRFRSILVGSSCFSCGGHEMLCPECGSRVDDGQERCLECRFQIRKPGLLRRLWNFFSGAKTKTLVTSPTLEYVTFVDGASGKRQVFTSFEEVPPDILVKIQEAQAQGKIVSQENSFIFQGADGQEHRYHSLEEMPSDIRAMYEQIVLPQIRAKVQAFGIKKESPDALHSLDRTH